MLLHVIFKDDLPISTSYSLQFLEDQIQGLSYVRTIQYRHNYEDIKDFGEGEIYNLNENIIHVECFMILFNQDFIVSNILKKADLIL